MVDFGCLARQSLAKHPKSPNSCQTLIPVHGLSWILYISYFSGLKLTSTNLDQSSEMMLSHLNVQEMASSHCMKLSLPCLHHDLLINDLLSQIQYQKRVSNPQNSRDWCITQNSCSYGSQVAQNYNKIWGSRHLSFA